MSRKAGELYYKAAQLLQEDSPLKPQCLYHALSYSLRAGGLTVGEFVQRAAAAEATFRAPEACYKPVFRVVDSRDFVLSMLEGPTPSSTTWTMTPPLLAIFLQAHYAFPLPPSRVALPHPLRFPQFLRSACRRRTRVGRDSSLQTTSTLIFSMPCLKI